MRTLEEHNRAYAAHATERMQTVIDTIATRYYQQPGYGSHLTLSDDRAFPELQHVQVDLANRALTVTDLSGKAENVDLKVFVTELATPDSFDVLRNLFRALGQRADGRPLGGDGVEG